MGQQIFIEITQFLMRLPCYIYELYLYSRIISLLLIISLFMNYLFIMNHIFIYELFLYYELFPIFMNYFQYL